MKAIRCKSKKQAQAFNHVMVRKGYLVLLLVLVAKETKVSSKKVSSLEPRSLNQSQKFEYCVKILMLCHLIWDSPPDYEDFDNANVDSMKYAHGNSHFKDDYKKANCIPPGLSKKDLLEFWVAVAEWEMEVRNLFLVEKFLPIIKESDNAITINLWGLLHLRKSVMCYRKLDPKATLTPTPTPTPTRQPTTQLTTTSNEFSSTLAYPSTSSCNGNTEIGIWINQQINGSLALDKLIKKMLIIVGKIERHIHRKCCPYEPIRDRVEVVHDGIDFLLQLNGIEPYKRAQSTGYIGSDFDNLKTRLEYLSLALAKGAAKGNRSVGKCCPAWSDQYNTFQVEMEENFEKLEADSSDLTAYLTNLIDKQEALEMDRSDQVKLLQSLDALHGSPASESTERCCPNQEKDMENIEKILKDLKLSDGLPESIATADSLQDRLTKANANLISAKGLLNDEEANIRKMASLCGEFCPSQKKGNIDYQSAKVSQLEEQMKEINDKAPEIIELLKSPNWPEHLKAIEKVRQEVKDFMTKQRQDDVNQQLAMVPEEPSESVKKMTHSLEELEAKLSELRPKNQTYEQLLLDSIGGLEQRLRDRLSGLNAMITKTEADADKCNSNCDWGNLPPMEELQERVKEMAALVVTK
ncbi:uncharacterized protein LOC108153608 isoform X2 [Drosophila miranda]|uniref:uncharacterized protein LOC108153608 isoform X2 n=1 Tax=Drosophila miranda TaxID=7229 RepID=UPI0007E7FA4D|nr:uncharacterized protein LOC108153608 isoform X2 [Drosophila miranda]